MKITIELEDLIELITKYRKKPVVLNYEEDIEAKAVAFSSSDLAPAKVKPKRKKSAAKLKQPRTDWLKLASELAKEGIEYRRIASRLNRSGYTTKHGKKLSPGAVSAALWRLNNGIEQTYVAK